MRFMFDYNEILDVVEIKNAEASMGYYHSENATDFIVTLYEMDWDKDDPDNDFFTIQGEYKLDGTKETYDDACENWEEVSEKLLILGFCKASDFKNFEWY